MLLIKQLAGEALGFEEKEELAAWLEQSEENRKFYQEWNSASTIAKNTLRYRELREWRMEQPYDLMKQKTVPVKRSRIGYWYVAAAILVLGFAAYFYFGLPKSHDKGSTLANTQSGNGVRSIQPASQRATLTINGQTSYALDSIPVGKIFEGIAKEKNGELQYLTQSTSERPVEHKVSTPAGGFYNLTLSDGTHVMLNAATELTYSSVFAKNERKVYLNGEAFFMVSKEKDRPFIVATKAGEVTVLGTHFDVKAYDQESMTTSLVEGAVKVKSNSTTKVKMLRPGNQALINEEGDMRLVEDGDVLMASAWRTGLFYFSDAGIKDVMSEVGRWYGVQVVYTSEQLPKRLLTGSFDRKLTLEELIKVLQKVAKVKLTIEGNKLIVQP